MHKLLLYQFERRAPGYEGAPALGIPLYTDAVEDEKLNESAGRGDSTGRHANGRLAQSGPGFGYHHRISWIVGIIFDRSRQAQAAGIQVNELPQMGHILRCLVGHAGDIVLVDQQDHLPGSFSLLQLQYIDDVAVADAAPQRELRPALAFHLLSRLLVPA